MEYKEVDIDKNWLILLTKLKQIFNKTTDVEGILFLIGINELGHGPKTYTKEQKQDLIHIGTCKALSLSNHYRLEGLDKDGWPHWKLIKNIPSLSNIEQENYMKWHILEYFENEQNL